MESNNFNSDSSICAKSARIVLASTFQHQYANRCWISETITTPRQWYSYQGQERKSNIQPITDTGELRTSRCLLTVGRSVKRIHEISGEAQQDPWRVAEDTTMDPVMAKFHKWMKEWRCRQHTQVCTDLQSHCYDMNPTERHDRSTAIYLLAFVNGWCWKWWGVHYSAVKRT